MMKESLFRDWVEDEEWTPPLGRRPEGPEDQTETPGKECVRGVWGPGPIGNTHILTTVSLGRKGLSTRVTSRGTIFESRWTTGKKCPSV